MFKISKLEQVSNEKIIIKVFSQEKEKIENNCYESFDILCFDISGDDYSFAFELNCKLEKLLEISLGETVNFNDYIGETWINIKNLNGVEPNMDIKITRYLKNKFIIFLIFYTDYSYDDNDYSGIIEFSFDLDEYLKK